MKKIGTEEKYCFDSFTFKVGTTDKHSPVVIYAEGGAFLEPINNKLEYLSEIKHVAQSIKKMAAKIEENSPFFNSHIVSYDIAEDRIKKNKKTYLSIQLYFRQRNNNEYSDLKESLVSLLSHEIPLLSKEMAFEGFLCTKSKK